MNKIPVGYKAIVERLTLCTLPHFRESYIAKQGRGKTIIKNHHEIHIYPKTYALKNEDNLLENLEFALKYDGINLEIIKALFENIEKNTLVKYIQKQPTGIYSRKIWYLYEFLMEDRLPLKDCQRVKHVDLVNPKMYFTASPIKSSRHAINNNLLGDNRFCPLVRRTEKIDSYIKENLENKTRKILSKYDAHLVARACNYLYTKETKSSFQIEREQPDKNRTARFVTLLQQASKIETLSKEKLIELQNAIVDSRYKDSDYRSTQNYVGENINYDFQKIHFISPKPEDVEDLMQGLLYSLDRMILSNIHPVIIAAIISFGFVFIHPFEDGNGRIHRFLIHHILSKTDFTPKDLIVPVSFIMLKNMRAYDEALESFSKPLLSILTQYDLTEDGMMLVKQDSKSYYQYLDYTGLSEYLFLCIEDAVNNHIEQELKFLMSYDKAKKSVQQIVDMPDNKIDLFIKLIIQNEGELSSSKRNSHFSELTNDEVSRIAEVINHTILKKAN